MTACCIALTIRRVFGLLVTLLSLLAAPPAQPTPDRHLVAYVITLGPGDEAWEKFGHNMLYFYAAQGDDDQPWTHVADGYALRDDYGRGVSFNWGMFDFDEPHFLWHFVQAKLNYWMAGYPLQIVQLYIDQDRTVTAQRLDLTLAQTRAMLDACETNAQESNRFYLYDYFRNNCSTKVRDAVDTAVDGQLKAQLTAIATSSTYRSESLRLTTGSLWLYIGLDFIYGHPTDRPLTAWEECFLPARLHDRLAQVRITDASGTRPLVAQEQVIHASHRAPLRDRAPRWWPYFLIAGLVLAGGCLLPAACTPGWLRMVGSIPIFLWLALSAVAGWLGLFIWLMTDHVAARPNENILQLSPLALPLLIALPLALRRGGRWTKIAPAGALLCAAGSLLGLLLKVLPAMDQVNANMIALALPANVGVALGLWRLYRCESKSLPPA